MSDPDTMHPKWIVEAGYDRIAERYAEWTGETLADERAQFVSLLCEQLPIGAEVLELGCATGVPTTRELVKRFAVTGVDISARSIALAKERVPEAAFVQADYTRLDLPPASFDAVIAFFTITHVPREEHAPLLRSIATWLRPGGLFVASLGAGDDPGTVEDEWLGAPMYFSGFDAATNRRLVQEAGLELLSAEEITSDEDGVPVTFLWVVARKPADAPNDWGQASPKRRQPKRWQPRGGSHDAWQRN
jgi:SAM-dependent methyltransferase